MPIKDSSNNRILPANDRAVHIAQTTIRELVPVQQRRYLAAFKVDGYEGIIYHHLRQGEKCSCSSSQKNLNSRLNEDGKASPGTINELITGSGSFKVNLYGDRPARTDLYKDELDLPSNSSVFDSVSTPSVFDIGGFDDESPSVKTQLPKGGVADNGPFSPADLDDLVDFDAGFVSFTDVACPICMGTGFVGGFEVFQGWRKVLCATTEDADFGPDGNILMEQSPWRVESRYATFRVVLPMGVVGIDAMRCFNNTAPVPCTFMIDGTVADSYTKLISFFDGKPHSLTVVFKDPTTFTHVELQANLSRESAYLGVPKMTQGQDTTLLEQVEPFQVILSPNVPSVRQRDVIAESTFGKVLYVEDSSWWNTRERNVLGWECNVRPVQPTELYNLLPRRKKVRAQQTTLNVRDNSTGNRRT